MQDEYNELKQKNEEEIVLSFIEAINNEDYETSRKYISEQVTVNGPVGSYTNANAYLKDLEEQHLKYKIKRAFIDGEDICLTYDIITADAKKSACGWYHVDDGRIDAIRVVTDEAVMEEIRARK